MIGSSGRVGDPAACREGSAGQCVVVVADEFGDGCVDGVEMDGRVLVDGEVPVVVSSVGDGAVGVVSGSGECPVVLGGDGVAFGAEGDDACRGYGGGGVVVGFEGGQEAVVVDGPEGQGVGSVVLDGCGWRPTADGRGRGRVGRRSEGCSGDEFRGVGQQRGGEVEGVVGSWVFSGLCGDGCAGWRWGFGQSGGGDRSTPKSPLLYRSGPADEAVIPC